MVYALESCLFLVLILRLCSGITSVDIVVLVDSSDIKQVKLCVTSLEQHNPPRDIIATRYIFVIDDVPLTVSDYVNCLCRSHPHFVCTETGRANGPVSGINKGIAIAKSLYHPASMYAVLHSDVVVSSYWLDSLCEVLVNTNDTVFAVGPVSNDAGYQSLFHTPQDLLHWSNTHTPSSLPPGVSSDSIAQLVHNISTRTAHSTPLLHGFCVLLKAAALQRIGLWDEIHFPMGYGEDYDLSLRARAAGYIMMVVPWVYIHHQPSHRYTPPHIVESSSQYLLLRYDSMLNEASKLLQHDISLLPLRAAVQNRLCELQETYSLPVTSQSFLFLCYIGHSALDTIINQVVALNRLGSKAALSVPVSWQYDNTKEYLLAKYPLLRPTSLIVHGGNIQYPFAISQDIIDASESYDVVIATSARVVEALKMIVAVHTHILPIYIIYDYEPWLVDTMPNDHSIIMVNPSAKVRDYIINTMVESPFIRFVYGSWLHDIIRNEFPNMPQVEELNTGIDSDFLVSRETWYKKQFKPFSMDGSGDKTYFVADIHDRIGWSSQLNVLDVSLRLVHAYGNSIHVTLLGCTKLEVVRLFHGLLAREKDSHLRLTYVTSQRYITCIADVSSSDQILLFHRADVYFDMSTWSRGTYAVDALTSGCLVVLPINGACSELCITHGACLCYNPADTIGYFVNLVLALVDSLTRSSILENSRMFVEKHDSVLMSAQVLSKVWKIRRGY